MSLHLLHPLMLVGLAALTLPILAHLLSRRKFDVVPWGAMQFLELDPSARRKIRLEEILLLLVRMGLVALLVFALSRPWMSGAWLTGFVSAQSRDVVLVIDGSYSMGWEGKAITPHAAAIRFAHQFLDTLRPGDTVCLLDARDQVRPVIESPTRDFDLVRKELDHLPTPSGTSNLAEGLTRAVQLLSRTTNLRREVVLLTDGQAHGWQVRNTSQWTRFDDLRQLPSVEPRSWVVNVLEGQTAPQVNFSVDRIDLSRELTVPDFPVRIRTKVHYSGGDTAVTRRVALEIDGQRLAEKTLQVRLQPQGETPVEFEHRFPSAGSHLISVVLDDDPLPGDNRADAAVSISTALPVLLVDGDPHLDPTRSETFFAHAALSAPANDTPWVRATVIPSERFTAESLHAPAVVVLANVPQLTAEQTTALQEYVEHGGGLLIALGDRIDSAAYNERLFAEGAGLLPTVLESIETDTARELQGVRVVSDSLELPWLARFRRENSPQFTQARFDKWWRVRRVERGREGEGERGRTDDLAASAPTILARLTTSDPLLLTRRFGRGNVVLMTSSLDADWNTLPAKPDYVPLLHELMFYLTGTNARRNVDAGTPLLLPVSAELPLEEYVFRGPSDTEFPPELAGDEAQPAARLTDTRLPGIYRFTRKDGRIGATDLNEYFVVNFDRSESDLTPLSADDRALLTANDRMTFALDLDDLRTRMYADDSRTEFWYLLLFAFVGILVAELAMTRRLVQGGHEFADEDAVTA